MSNTIDVGFSSATFEFRSHFPELHMPPYPVANPDHVNPALGPLILDGEPVALIGGQIVKLTTGNIGSTPQHVIYAMHAQPGRGDLQMASTAPIVMQDNWVFDTRLVTQNNLAAYVPGARLKAGLVATANLPLFAANQPGYIPAVAGDDYVAVVVELPRAAHNGAWVRCRWVRGTIDD